jgi:hypothetical protein
MLRGIVKPKLSGNEHPEEKTNRLEKQALVLFGSVRYDYHCLTRRRQVWDLRAVIRSDGAGGGRFVLSQSSEE